MNRRRFAAALVVSVCVVAASGFAARAGTTVVQAELGVPFTGSIGTAGADFVDARVNLVLGTAVKLTVRSDRGATLQPTVTLRDGTGTVVPLGTPLQIEWLPIRHAVYFFTVQTSGQHRVEIGGTSGSGGFGAVLEGTLPSGVQLILFSGTVTDAGSGAGVAGAVVTIGPFVLVADEDGNYSGRLPAGSYTATYSAPGYDAVTEAVEIAGSAVARDVELGAPVTVGVSAGVSGTAVPGGMVTATVDVELPEGETVTSIAWSQIEGTPALIAGGASDTATVTLGDVAAYRAHLIDILREPPIGPDELPENVPLPPGEFPGGLQDRFQVVGLNPFSLEEAGLVALAVEVVTSAGTFHDEVEVHTALPWPWAPGLLNVPVGNPVLLHGKTQPSYDWAMTPPAGSSATLADATTQNPSFTPDVPGMYDVVVTSDADGGPLTLPIYAGTWRGVVVDQDPDGRPVSDPACTVCHSTFAPDKFTPWAQTGHAEIFTDSVNTNTHYGPNCFSCHLVGFDTAVENNGADDVADYDDFIAAGLLNHPGDNWSTVLDQYPELARRANVQCENCHGPQSGAPGVENPAHGFAGPDGTPRTSLSSNVCATCHGEPLRHARFQQWQLSGHANHELAIEESTSGSCARCHTANGFLKWLPVLLDDDPMTDPLDNVVVDWTADEAHPQTCATCHDPHAIGTTTGVGTNATTRISGDTPPLIGGFQVTDAGRGAICMTCHNSRRGLRNDDVFPTFSGTELSRAPHGSAQTDVLVGQNAYLVTVGTRGSHSLIDDTCVRCHMTETPPPDVLSYNQGGTNHTFFAGEQICSNCHGSSFEADDVQQGVQNLLDNLQEDIEAALVDLMAEQIAANPGNRIDLNGTILTDVDDIDDIVFGEASGQQSVTVTLSGGTVVSTALGNVRVRDAANTSLGRLYDFAPPGLIKAGWNWNLFTNDGSQGVHNPAFAYSALIAGRQALAQLGAGAGFEFQPVRSTRVPEELMRTLDRGRKRSARD